MSPREMFTQEFWDQRYGGSEQLWSGRPNRQLVAHASALSPGRALDVGCGEGADAIWLAERGWTVTGLDVSPVGLMRAASHAREAGHAIAERIDWQQGDLFGDDPEPFGTYELVSSQYLHMPPESRARAFGRLASSVSLGGTLLVVSHHPADLEIPGLRPNVPELFYTASELAAQLDAERWGILVEAASPHTAAGPGGDPVIVHDAVLHARRHH